MKKLFILILVSFLFTLLFMTTSEATHISGSRYAKNATVRKTKGNITLVCEASCKFTKKQIRQALQKFVSQLKKTETKLGIPLPTNVKPIEVHVAYDKTCITAAPSFYTADKSTIGGFTSYDALEDGRILVCLNANLLKRKNIAAGHTPFIHELIHIYLQIRQDDGENIEENLVKSISAWVITNSTPKSMCSVAEKEPDLAHFCEKYDIEYAKIPVFLAKLMEIKREKGYLTNTIVKETITSLPNPR